MLRKSTVMIRIISFMGIFQALMDWSDSYTYYLDDFPCEIAEIDSQHSHTSKQSIFASILYRHKKFGGHGKHYCVRFGNPLLTSFKLSWIHHVLFT